MIHIDIRIDRADAVARVQIALAHRYPMACVTVAAGDPLTSVSSDDDDDCQLAEAIGDEIDGVLRAALSA